jgi:hypothetical protein
MSEKKDPSQVASEGGKARAAKLSPEQRSEIAKRAAAKRWGNSKRRATHAGTMTIGDAEINCYVLEDGKRIISTRGMMKALGRTWRGRKYTGTELPVFLEAKNLKPFISNDLEAVLVSVEFDTPKGTSAEGFEADLLRLTCEAYLSARDAGVLKPSQQVLAKQADILMRGFAKVGIIALVDEATGYQEDRARGALAEILEAFISEELRKWVKTFPDDYFNELARLRGVSLDSVSVKRPQYFGHLTNSIVYKRLAPGVKEELSRLTPKTESGNRKHRFFQRLSDDVGHPKLREHLASVIALMKASDDYDSFEKLLNRALPKYREMPLFDKIEERP